MQKKTKVIISVLVAVMVVIGGFYLYASRTVAKRFLVTFMNIHQCQVIRMLI